MMNWWFQGFWRLFMVTVCVVHGQHFYGADGLEPEQTPREDAEASAMAKVNRTLLKSLLEGMDPRIKPATADGSAVTVRCGFFILSFSEISEVSMDYKIGMYFRYIWSDPRLIYDVDEGPPYIGLSSKEQNQIWTPDLHFPNEKDAKFHSVTVPNTLMMVYPNGTVIHSVRLTMTLSCPMHLAAFPMDTQTCHINIESYAHESDDLDLVWMENPGNMDDEIELPQFNFYNMTFDRFLKNYQTTGTFTCLRASFELRRDFGFFLLQIYVPSILIIFLSWVSFWINKEAVPARITLGVTTVLTMTTHLSGGQASAPKVTHPTAMDVWMSTGMVFVFAALIEYAFVNALSRKVVSSATNKKNDDDVDADANDTTRMSSEMEIKDTQQDPECFANSKPVQKLKPWEKINHCKLADRMDEISRFLFPTAFIIFNLVYWPMYAG